VNASLFAATYFGQVQIVSNELVLIFIILRKITFNCLGDVKRRKRCSISLRIKEMKTEWRCKHAILEVRHEEGWSLGSVNLITLWLGSV
jgi:hypothetical protein